MLIVGCLWLLLGLSLWIDFNRSCPPKDLLEWSADLFLALPIALACGPILLILRIIT